MKVIVKMPNGDRKAVQSDNPIVSAKAILNRIEGLGGTQFQVTLRRGGQARQLEFGSLANLVCEDGDIIEVSAEIAGGRGVSLLLLAA